ncbi:MAG TPA: Rieske 2Fe-2S domain-containing protein [Pirellulales bacterium]|jgi:menaquinol-cytochrome c reductase iron-sulfur subunit|nr:Rieske 2Fe-2S domain-containing protein [Pirellulales bacterium]
MATPVANSPARTSAPPAKDRRGFLAIVLGALVAIVPFASGLAVFLDPLRRNGRGGRFVRVTGSDAVPADGIPREFPVVTERVDAWNRSVEPIGAVYLRRTSEDSAPECWSATCPHAGCFVAYDGETNSFKCPCHNSTFTVEGQVIEPSPSPRNMDTLECRMQGDEILVKFENFYTGKAEKIVKQ